RTAPSSGSGCLRDLMDVVLPRHWHFPIDDVDFAQRNLRIPPCQLLQAWRQLSARATPVRIKIDNGHVAESEMLIDVHLRAVRNDFDWLAAASDQPRLPGTLCRIRGRDRGIVMKSFLNLFWQLDEIHFRDSRIRS